MSTKINLLQRRPVLPKIKACMRKNSIEEFRAKILYKLDFLGDIQVRRRKIPLHECLVLEMTEGRFFESAQFLQDIIYDNEKLIREDDIGFMLDIRKKSTYLEVLCKNLVYAERARAQDDARTESLIFLYTAMYFSTKEHGVYWLADKLFLVSIAVSSKYTIDGGRLTSRCKYYFCKFLLDKFPGIDTKTIKKMLTSVRDAAMGKTWLLYDQYQDNVSYYEESGTTLSDAEDLRKLIPMTGSLTISKVTSLELYGILYAKSVKLRKVNPMKAEALARLAEKRAQDAENDQKVAEAIIEIGACQVVTRSYINAKKSFRRALTIYLATDNVSGICQARLHIADVMQRNGEYLESANLLTNVGALALQYNLKRYLGASLHLHGELFLRAGNPDQSTSYFKEAFFCFKGFRYKPLPTLQPKSTGSKSSVSEDDTLLNTVLEIQETMDYDEQAEHSRLMAAVSFGQEHMKSYYDLLQESVTCAVARARYFEWHLLQKEWWQDWYHYQFVPCECPKHNRTIFDIINMKRQMSISSPSEKK